MPTARRTEKPSPEARILGLAAFILSQPDPVSRAQIYAAFPGDYGGRPDAAEKKFSRDKDALRRLGYHVVVEDETYAIDPRACTLPPIELTPDEAAAVWTAGAAALRFAAHPLQEELESALRKLLVGAKGLPPPRAAAEALAVDARPPSEARLDRLIDAWERRKRIAIDYLRVGTGEVTRREVDVYGWAHRRGEWIFVGFCHLRNAVRIFYLSRVRNLKVNARPLPGRGHRDGDYDVPDDFDVRRWSRQEIWEYDVHASRAAAVRFRGSLARIARQLLPAARVSTEPDGVRVARLEVANLRGLVRQALAWGPEAEVIEPEDGRAIAREILAGLAGRAP